jgi:hypothetical protein
MPWFGRRRKEVGEGGGGDEAATRSASNADQSADAGVAASATESPTVSSADEQLDASVRVIDTNPAHTNREQARRRTKRERISDNLFPT